MAGHGLRQVGVVGAGQMGLGIAYVTSTIAKVPVILLDRDGSQLEKALAFADKLLKKDVEKSRFTKDEAKDARERMSTTTKMDDLGQVGFVVEAATEQIKVKHAIFQSLASTLRPDAVLATNTSSISITRIAREAIDSRTGESRASQVVGQHWMNPVPVMKLVEIITGLETSKETLEKAQLFASACGKTTTTSRDEPGFIANRVLMPYINEAIEVLNSGIASLEDIDTTMKLGTNVPMGPLTLADFIGLDTCLEIMRVLHQETGDSKYRPSTLLVRMVDAGRFGKKNKKGFYLYQ